MPGSKNSLTLKQRLRRLLASCTPGYFPVAWKLGLTISVLVLVGMSLLGSILVKSQAARMQQQTDTFARTIVNQLADSAREPLLAQDTFNLKILLNNLTQGSDLKGAAVFGHDGKPLQAAGNIPYTLTDPATQPRVEWQLHQEPITTYTTAVKFKGLVVGFVSVSLSQQAIAQAQKEAEYAIIAATLLMTLLIICAAFLVGRWLARPLSDLVTGADAIREGNLRFRLHEKRNDELGQLINSYNEMAAGLQEKDQVEDLLSRFVSPGVARLMMTDLDQVQLGGRETEATVIFADIVGFTQLSETLAPDEVANLLNDYFNAISAATRNYHGIVDKYVGDCAMLVFGVPEDDPKHLYHGLCCALMVQQLVASVNQRRHANGQLTVSFRIGLNSGKVLAGNLGSIERMQYTVVGDTVNLASRLSNHGSAGDIVLPQCLLEAPDIAALFQFTPSGEIQVRGKSLPVTIAKLDGMQAPQQDLINHRIDEFMQRLAQGGKTLPPLHPVEPL